MPVGIENLATGFLQGLNARKQQERQDVIDQREAERFDMQKQQFADTRASNALSLKSNQFNLTQVQAKAERDRILQEEADNFHNKMKGYFAKQAQGDYNGFYSELEKDSIATGINGQFVRDENGNIKVDAKGNAIWKDAKLNKEMPFTPDSALQRYYEGFNPEKTIASRIAAQAEQAKEQRDYGREVAKLGTQHANAKELKQMEIQAKKEAEENRLKLKDPKKYLSKPTQDSFYDVQEIIDPFTKQKSYSKPIFNQDRYDDFMLFSHANNLDPDDNAYRLWRKSTRQVAQQPSGANGLNAVKPKNSPVDLLRGKNISTEQDAANAIRELRAKKFTDEQINAAFDELGL